MVWEQGTQKRRRSICSIPGACGGELGVVSTTSHLHTPHQPCLPGWWGWLKSASRAQGLRLPRPCDDLTQEEA